MVLKVRGYGTIIGLGKCKNSESARKKVFFIKKLEPKINVFTKLVFKAASLRNSQQILVRSRW
jgi:hypothetical protein